MGVLRKAASIVVCPEPRKHPRGIHNDNAGGLKCLIELEPSHHGKVNHYHRPGDPSLDRTFKLLVWELPDIPVLIARIDGAFWVPNIN